MHKGPQIHSVMRMAVLSIIVATFLVDTFIPWDVAIAVLYVIAIILSVNAFSDRGLAGVGVACAGLTLSSFLISHAGHYQSDAAGRCAVALIAIGMTMLLALWLQRTLRSVRAHAALLDLTQDAIIVRDVRHGADRIAFWNVGAEALYGWRWAEAKGQRIDDLLLTRSLERPAKIARTLETDGHWNGELFQSRRDGTPVTVSSRWSRQLGRNGAPASILQINSDVTERKLAEDDLERARSELAHAARVATMGELTASITHEVRQPISAIVTDGDSCLRWLSRDVPDLAEVRACVDRMIANARRTDDVVARLRAFARRETAEHTLFGVNDIVDDVLQIVGRECALHAVELNLDLMPVSQQVFGDRVQLQQVLLNLIMNAIQAMAPMQDRKRVLSLFSRVDTAEDSGVECSVIEVRDTGPGISSAALSRLFAPFFTTKRQGMGMGLSICRSIVEAHGGRIGVAESQSTGTTFKLSLPVHIPARHSIDEAADQESLEGLAV